jgi:hypothetical protein
MVMVATLFFQLGTQSVYSAAPPKKDCGQMSGAPGNDPGVYDRLKCRHDAVAEQLEFMATAVFNENTPLGKELTRGQLGQVKSAKAKAERSRNKSAKEDFKKLSKGEAKSNKNSCHLVPFRTQDDLTPKDGICDWEQGIDNALCAAIELDTDGNLQACNPLKKNKGKKKDGVIDLECDQICDPEESQTADEEVQMQAEAQAIEASYDAAEDELQDMNNGLENLNHVLSTSPVNSSLATTNSCAEPSTLPEGLAVAASVLRVSAVTAHGVANVAGKGCNQVAVAFGFGGNGSIVCAVLEGAATVVEIAYTVVDEVLKAKTDELQSSTFACLQGMKDSTDAGFAMLSGQHANIMANDNKNTTEITNQIEAVRQELNTKLDQAILLLNTPLGQRGEFPAK